MSDSCVFCTARGDVDKCEAMKCHVRDSWHSEVTLARLAIFKDELAGWTERAKEAERLLSLARAVIEALPKCEHVDLHGNKCGEVATCVALESPVCERHGFDYRHKPGDPDKRTYLPYRSALLAWKEAER